MKRTADETLIARLASTYASRLASISSHGGSPINDYGNIDDELSDEDRELVRQSEELFERTRTMRPEEFTTLDPDGPSWLPREPPPTAVIEEKVQALTRALAKLPPHIGACFRAGAFDEDILSAYVPGAVLIENGFVSASVDPVVFGNVRYRFLSHSAKPVWSFSPTPEEREVVFTAHTTFSVLAHDVIGDIHWVLMADTGGPPMAPSQREREHTQFISESRAGYAAWTEAPAERASRLTPARQDFAVGLNPDGTPHLA